MVVADHFQDHNCGLHHYESTKRGITFNDKRHVQRIHEYQNHIKNDHQIYDISVHIVSRYGFDTKADEDKEKEKYDGQ